MCTRGDFSRQMLDFVEELLRERPREPGTPWNGVQVEDVSLHEDREPPEIRIRFSHRDRPGSRYGFAFPTRVANDPTFYEEWSAREWAEVAVINFRERIEATDLSLRSSGRAVLWLE
jgi:hypothetical protein